MLPASKENLPKCLYLDQNKWISLARTANKLDDSLFAVFDAIKQAVALGTIIVPLSDIHILETLAPGGIERRHRLAQTMLQLSKNLAIRPARIIQEAEISCAVADILGFPLSYEIRPDVVVVGLMHALGGSVEVSGEPAKVAEFQEHVSSPEFTMKMLTDEEFRARSAYLRDKESTKAEEKDLRRAEALSALTKEELLQVDVLSLIKKERILARIRHTLNLLSVPAASLNPHLSSFQQHLQFIRKIPTLDVLLTLSQERYKNPHRNTHRNDAKDIGFLTVAIPYANFVVTERYWAHVSNQTGLAQQYKTIVIAALEELPELLRSEGCIDDHTYPTLVPPIS